MPLPAGFDGDVTTLARRSAVQAVRGVPASTSFRDFESGGSPWAITTGLVDAAAFSGTGAPNPQQRGKDELSSDISMGSVDINNHGLLLFLANLLRAYDINNLGTGVEEWLFGFERGTDAAPFLTSLEDNDVAPRMRLVDHLITSLTLSAQAGNPFALSFGALAGYADFHGDPTQTTGTGSTLPEVLGDWGNAHSEGTPDDIDLFLTVDTDNGDGTFEILARVGIAAATGTTTFTVTPGIRARIFDEDGNAIGGRQALQPSVFFPAGATLVALDEFRIPARRAAWAQTILPEKRIGTSEAFVLIDGVESDAEGGFELSVERPDSVQNPHLSRAQGWTTKQQGPLPAVLNLTQEITGWSEQERMHLSDSQNRVPVVIDARHDALIGATVFKGKFQVVLPACQVSGQLFSPAELSTETQEAPTMTAHDPVSPYTYDGVSYSGHIGIRVVTEIATL